MGARHRRRRQGRWLRLRASSTRSPGTTRATCSRRSRGLSGDIETLGRRSSAVSRRRHYRVVLDPVALAKRATAGNPDATSPARPAHRRGRHRRCSARRLDRRERASYGSCRSTSRRRSSRAVSPSSASLAFELWDYGEPVEIDVPPASQVADASSLDTCSGLRHAAAESSGTLRGPDPRPRIRPCARMGA